MCGITGYSGMGDASILEAMNNIMVHRGPDDKGISIVGSTGLAQRRLAIIDVSPAGHQPMTNETGTVTLVFNGEIYNYKELRGNLKRKHVFKGQSDTEVIVHLYEEVGTEVFSYIHGMFTVALFDSAKNQLIVARDRMGKKPLFWGIHGKTFLFGSELKALLKHPLFEAELDLNSVHKYFLYEYVPTPHTMFKNTHKLEPGTFLIWNGREAKKSQFWKPHFLPKKTSFARSIRELDEHLSSAVEARLVSDVPLGIFLSGGLDSSTIAYYASRAHSNIKTFSIGFEEASFDESSFARSVAAHLGTDHYEKMLSIRECLDIIPLITRSLDEPMADASIVPTYLLSRFAREHVTVALGGDGGDELLCGYDTLIAHRLAFIYEKVPRQLRESILMPLVNRLPSKYTHLSLDFLAKKFVNGFDDNRLYRNQRWQGAFDRHERGSLFVPDLWDKMQGKNEYHDIDRYMAEVDSGDFYDKLGYIYQRMYMMDQVLVKVDRASMMNSLEVRAPFLDTRVVDLTNSMPVSFKMKGLQRKYILKKLMEGKLPHDIIYRKKKGFGMPIGLWLRTDLRSWCDRVLSKERIESVGFFNFEYVDGVKQAHYSGRENNYKKLWTLLIFMEWYEHFVQK